MAANPDLPEQMRVLLILIPSILAAIAALKFCSALAAYWTVSNCYSAVQTGALHYVVARRIRSGPVRIWSPRGEGGGSRLGAGRRKPPDVIA
jgi:membrane protein insertase Oxa1/YidC/SpoIIIJ